MVFMTMLCLFHQMLNHTRRVYSIFPPALAGILIFVSSLEGAPRSQYYQDPNATSPVREMRDSIENIRNDVANHEVEIRTFDEKLKNVDAIIESVRDQLNDFHKWQKEQLKGNTATLEAKMSTMDAALKSIVGDLRQFQTHSNETVAVMAQYKQKFVDIEKEIDHQNLNIEHLQAAMRSLMEALQVKAQSPITQNGEPIKARANKIDPSLISDSDRTYKVKSGDSLEKIARAHQTSIQSIKDANGLTTDRIVVGKTLVIPEK